MINSVAKTMVITIITKVCDYSSVHRHDKVEVSRQEKSHFGSIITHTMYNTVDINNISI